MATLVVGVGDCKVSKDPGDVLVTHALGSCIAIDDVQRVRDIRLKRFEALRIRLLPRLLKLMRFLRIPKD